MLFFEKNYCLYIHRRDWFTIFFLCPFLAFHLISETPHRRPLALSILNTVTDRSKRSHLNYWKERHKTVIFTDHTANYIEPQETERQIVRMNSSVLNKRPNASL